MRSVTIGSEERQLLSLVLAQADLVIAAISLLAACWVHDSVFPAASAALWSPQVRLLPRCPLALVGTIPILLGSLYLVGAYQAHRLHSMRQVLVSLVEACLLSALFLLACVFLFRNWIFLGATAVTYLVCAHCGSFGVRCLAHAVQTSHSQSMGPANTVVVGTGPGAKAVAEAMRRRHYRHRVLGFVRVPDEQDGDPAADVLGTIDDLPRIVDHMVVDAVVFGTRLEESARYEPVIRKLEEVGTTIHLRGDAVETVLSRTLIGHLDGMPILTIQSTPFAPVALRLKRLIDIVGAIAGLVGFAPVMLLAAVAIKVESPGPILYRQERLGLKGRRFVMLKLRSMYDGSEDGLTALAKRNEMSGPVFKIRNDPRTTPVGRWLRRYSIDEMPQFWNVLVGQMSLVGPRPPLEQEVEQYERWQRRRLSVKPGITCLWQVGGRNDLDFDTWMKLDMEYIDNWSLELDLKILLRTVPAVLTARGAA